MGRLDGKVVIVTGGARGIGRATAEACAREGAAVAIGDVLTDEGRAAADGIVAAGGRAIFLPADVTDDAQCAQLAAATEDAFGPLTGLVNDAGIMRGAFVQVDELDPATFDQVIDVNIRGSFLMARHAVPRLAKLPGGVIVQIASGAGVFGGSSSVAYGASKGGAHGLALSLEHHLAGRGIRVHAVCPGALNTPLKVQNVRDGARAHGIPEEKALAEAKLHDPAGVARVVAFLLSDDAALVRGTIRTA